MKSSGTFLMLILTLISSLNAQQRELVRGDAPGRVSGRVTGQDPTGLPFATLLLLRLPDSIALRTAISDTTGRYQVDRVPEGRYVLKASLAGYTTGWSTEFTIGKGDALISLPAVSLLPKNRELNEVQLTATKKLVEGMPGGFVYHAAQNATAKNGDAADLLKQVPGVHLNPNGNILLRGSGPLLLVNGKEIKLTGADLANFLKGLPAANISTIEVSTTPTAKYPAAGDAGIIDLRLKKNTTSGLSGNVSLSGSTQFSVTHNGSFNYNAGKMAVSADYNTWYSGGSSREHSEYRSLSAPDSLYHFRQRSTSTSASDAQFLNTTFSYDLTSRTALGADLKLGRFRGDYPATYEAGIYGRKDDVQAQFNQQEMTKLLNHYVIYDVNFQHRSKTPGRELSGYLNGASYGNGSLTGFSQQYTRNGTSKEIPDRRNDADYQYRFYTGKLDYLQPWGPVKLSMGFKTDYTAIENDYNSAVRDASFTEYQTDAALSDRFYYDQNIAASYLTLAGKTGKLALQGGLRLEHTWLKVRSAQNGRSAERSYAGLFPSFSIKYELAKGKELSLSAGRRIQRPYYSYLNPFIDNSNANYYRTGNPMLDPSYVNRAELQLLNYWGGGRQMTMVSVYVSQASGVIGARLVHDPGYDRPLSTFVNYRGANGYGMSVTAQHQLIDWWSLSSTVSGRLISYRSGLAQVVLAGQQGVYSANFSSTFNLRAKYTLQVTGYYQSPYNTFQTRVYGTGQVSASLQKDFLLNRLNVNLAANDLLHSLQSGSVTTSDVFQSTEYSQSNSRYLTLRASWKFGKAVQARKKVLVEGNGQY